MSTQLAAVIDIINNINKININDLESFNYNIRTKIYDLDEKLADLFVATPQYAEYLIKIILFYTDEKVRGKLKLNYNKWTLLQQDKFNINNGGEEFYKIIDIILNIKAADYIIYAIPYLLLKENFTGIYYNKSSKISNYQQQLKHKLVNCVDFSYNIDNSEAINISKPNNINYGYILSEVILLYFITSLLLYLYIYFI